MKDSPTISVVIPTYNRAYIVGRAIQSILNQTYQDFEIIVVDDGSTDNTEEVVKGFGDDRLRYTRHKENSGASAAPRNTGIQMARGEYVAFLSSDDEWLPQMLEKQINKFESLSPDVGVVYCGYACIVEKTGEILSESVPTVRGDVFRSMIEESMTLGDLTPLIRKECFEKAGIFDTEFSSAELWDLLIRISKYYKFDFVPEILCKYYIHPEQGATSLERVIQGQDLRTRKYQSYLSKTAVSNRFRHFGTLCCYQGDFKKAGRYFREAIITNPLNIQAYILFLLCKLAPRLYQARLKRLRAKSGVRDDILLLQ
jgi:glycosyltransferase involved in cell wall biosynthesis